MSTHSHIGIKLPGNKVRWIYCHFDGYREYMYPMLSENYTTIEQVNALIDLGDASCIRKTIQECDFYSRDRGELAPTLKPKVSSFDNDISKEWHFNDETYRWLFDPETLKWERY